MICNLGDPMSLCHPVSGLCSSLQTHWRRFTATHCNTLQHTATHSMALHHTASHCIMLHHTALHSNTLLHTQTHFITLQHSPTQSNIHTLTHWSAIFPTHSLTHGHTHSHTDSHTHTPTHTPTHTLTHIPTHTPTHTPTHKPTHKHTHAPTRPLTHSLSGILKHQIHTRVHTLAHPHTLTHTYPPIHTFTHPNISHTYSYPPTHSLTMLSTYSPTLPLTHSHTTRQLSHSFTHWMECTSIRVTRSFPPFFSPHSIISLRVDLTWSENEKFQEKGSPRRMTWPMYMKDMTRSCVTWHIYTCGGNHSHAWHDLMCECDMTPSYSSTCKSYAPSFHRQNNFCQDQYMYRIYTYVNFLHRICTRINLYIQSIYINL